MQYSGKSITIWVRLTQIKISPVSYELHHLQQYRSCHPPVNRLTYYKVRRRIRGYVCEEPSKLLMWNKYSDNVLCFPVSFPDTIKTGWALSIHKMSDVQDYMHHTLGVFWDKDMYPLLLGEQPKIIWVFLVPTNDSYHISSWFRLKGLPLPHALISNNIPPMFLENGYLGPNCKNLCFISVKL